MVFSDSSLVWPMEAHPLMIRPSKPSPTQRPDMFRPCGCSTKYSVPLDRIEPSLAAYQPITISLSQSRSSLGAQTDTRIIRHGTALPGTGQVLDGQAVANYIAKDATKTLTAAGLPSQRLRGEADLGHLRCTAHIRRLITTAWQLGSTRPASRCRAWAHMLGYGGHFLTKSRRYSVTFGQLRAARTEHRRASRPPDADRDAWGRPLDETVVLVLPTTWTYGGTDLNPTTPVAELAAAAAARAREHRDPGAAIGGRASITS